MKLVMLESGGWGGIGHYTYNLCQALAGAGCDVALQTAAPYELAELPRDFDLRTSDPSASYGARKRAVLGLLRETGAPILHLQSTMSARRDWLWLARMRKGGTRLVTTAHNVLPHDRAEREAFGMEWSFGRIYSTSDRIVAHGAETRDQIVSRFGVPRERIAVIPLGDFRFAAGDADRDDARAWLGLPADAQVLLAFGAMREYKGIPELIEAFHQAASRLPDARLLIVGKPIRIDVDEYRARIAELDLEDRVLLRPEYVPFADIGRYFAACDVAVYPYRNIYQSGALQLAYGAAKPVIATRVGELPATVRDGENGTLVPPEDPAALAEAICTMLERPREELEEMGRRSLELAEQEYGWDDVARTTVELYRAVMEGAPSAG